MATTILSPEGRALLQHAREVIISADSASAPVSITQEVIADDNNSSTTNLDAGNSYTFTGEATSTLGVVGLQWSLKADQNATVYIEESDDEINWDISRSFDYIFAKGGRGETVQASKAYWRIRVVLTGTAATTYFRLAGVLCPFATPLPSALSPDGRLLSENTLTGQQNTERHVWVSPVNQLSTMSTVRLVGTNFDGTTKDPNFWTETVANSGTVTQAGGEIELDTNTVPDGSAAYASIRRARFVVGSALQFTSAVNFVTAGTANNVRRIGAYDANDGYFFQLNGTTFSLGSRKATVDTLVNTGSFNGNYGLSFTPVADTYYKLDIEWTPLGVFFYVNGVLLHKVIQAHLSNYNTLPITIENVNSGGSATDVAFDCVGAVIVREGELTTNSTFYHLSGNAATHVLKYGAGVLHRVAYNNTSGTTLTMYDGVSAAGDVIGIITTTSNAIGVWSYDVPFNDGLTLVTVGNSLDATIVYE